MNLRILSITIIFVLALTSCSSVSSPPKQTPTRENPRETSAESDFGFDIAEDGSVTITTNNAEGFKGSKVSEGDTEIQLRSGVELAIENLQLSQSASQTLLEADFINKMQGFVIHSLSFMIESQDAVGNVTKQELSYGADSWTNDYLLADDSMKAKLVLPANTKTIKLSAFADTADHVVIGLATALQAQQLNNIKYARNSAQLANYVRNASFNTVISFDAGLNENDAFEISETLLISTKVRIQGYINPLTGKADHLGVLEAADGFRGSLFQVQTGGDLSLTDLILRKSRSSAVLNEGTLTLTRVRFQNNEASSGSAVGVYGGAIYNEGKLFMIADPVQEVNTEFRNNRAENGGAIYNTASGEISLDGGLVFEQNRARFTGGAIYNAGNITTRLSQADNRLSFGENRALAGPGGAINNRGNLELVNAHFADNTAFDIGGAIFNDDDAEILGGSFHRNTASLRGGAITNHAQMSLSDAILESNSSASGAAVYTCNGQFFMRQSLLYANTFDDDQVDKNGLAIAVEGSCRTTNGLIRTQQTNTGSVELEHVTIWSNNGVEGQYGTGLYLANGASASVKNSIVAMNKGGSWFMSDVDADDPDSVSFTSSNSFYSVMDKFPLGSGDIASTDPSKPLDPLLSVSAEGYLVPSASSLVINAGECSSDDTDIRGKARQSGSNCDMGAVELTTEELSARQGVQILEILPEHPGYVNQALISFDNQYLRIRGKADTRDLVALRYSHNYAAFESYDLAKLVRDAGDFEFAFNYLGITDGALRDVADGLSMIIVEAEYADGTVERVEQDFLVHVECLRTTTGACNGTLDYSAGAMHTYSTDLADFIWWEINSINQNTFTLSVQIDAITNLALCGRECPLQRFSYRINDNATVSYTEGDLRGLVKPDGSYSFDIPVSNLKKGLNGIVIGSMYADIRVQNQVLHFDLK